MRASSPRSRRRSLRPVSAGTTKFRPRTAGSRPMTASAGLIDEAGMGFTTARRKAPAEDQTVFEFSPPEPDFGPLNEGFAYQMSVSMKNVTATRQRFRIIHTEKVTKECTQIRCLSDPTQLAPGCSFPLQLEIKCHTLGFMTTQIEIHSEHQEHVLEVRAHVLGPGALAALGAELRAKGLGPRARGVRALGPLALTPSGGAAAGGGPRRASAPPTAAGGGGGRGAAAPTPVLASRLSTMPESIASFAESEHSIRDASPINVHCLRGASERSSDGVGQPKIKFHAPNSTVEDMEPAQRFEYLRTASRRVAAFFGEDDLEDLHTVPVHPAMYWDPSKHRLCLDPEQMGCILDEALTPEEARATWEHRALRRQRELESGGLIPSGMILALREYGLVRDKQDENADEVFSTMLPLKLNAKAYNPADCSAALSSSSDDDDDAVFP